jgi:predicted enzyme related to lactoylglutathione lyase
MRIYYLEIVTTAVGAVVKAGGELAHPPMEIPGHGTFAIYLQGGIDHGLWQRAARAGA